MSLRVDLRSRTRRFRYRAWQYERRVAWRVGISRRKRDSLTGLRSTLWFTAALRRSLRGRDGALVLIDVDDFIYHNDERGHERGDELLIAMAARLQTVCAGESCYRVGGDEFALLLIDADLDTAAAIAERARATIEDSFADLEPLTRPGHLGRVTLTVTCSVIAWNRNNRPRREQVLSVATGLNAVGKAERGNVVASAEIDWQAGQVERLCIGEEERELIHGAPLNTLADPLYHFSAAEATTAVS